MSSSALYLERQGASVNPQWQDLRRLPHQPSSDFIDHRGAILPNTVQRMNLYSASAVSTLSSSSSPQHQPLNNQQHQQFMQDLSVMSSSPHHLLSTSNGQGLIELDNTISAIEKEMNNIARHLSLPPLDALASLESLVQRFCNNNLAPSAAVAQGGAIIAPSSLAATTSSSAVAASTSSTTASNKLGQGIASLSKSLQEVSDLESRLALRGVTGRKMADANRALEIIDRCWTNDSLILLADKVSALAAVKTVDLEEACKLAESLSQKTGAGSAAEEAAEMEGLERMVEKLEKRLKEQWEDALDMLVSVEAKL